MFQNNKLYMYKMDRDEEDEEDESASEVTSEEPPKNGVTEEQEEELPREEVRVWLCVRSGGQSPDFVRRLTCGRVSSGRKIFQQHR